jgi:hypothetical protein
VAPAEAGSAFVGDRTGRVRDILCIQEERRVGNDNRQYCQVARPDPADPAKPAAVPLRARHGASAQVPRRAPGIFHGSHLLADYDPQGNLCDDVKLAA